ncbi:Disease resistance protein [Quillaja saponaria]|uniref:Disease resistance protein n=1 Tax=Quillaja saponaria TaxID=32244 RepID=A0AAD7PPW6_QUISA|nr:Disease resistance protein [Quillaja saponaria]
MAKIALSFALEQLSALLKEEPNLLRGIHKQVADIKDELEFIQAFLKNADSRAEVELRDINNHGVKTWLLKVLDFEGSPLDHVPDDLGNLFHLRYLSLRNTNVKRLPSSIGKLQNLETLDLKQTLVDEIPTEITQLRKLRHLLPYYRNYNIEYCLTMERGVKIANDIGCLMSLQKLYHVEANHGGVDLIKELGKLRQLRTLGIKHLTRVNGKALCASIDKMSCLESLDITSITQDEIIDLQSVNISSPPPLRRLYLKGRFEKLPIWILQLHNLVRLEISYSKITDPPLKSLQHLPNLLQLEFTYDTYDGEQLHFEEGRFLKLN